MYFLASEAVKPPLPLRTWFYVNTDFNYPGVPKPTQTWGEKRRVSLYYQPKGLVKM